MRQDGKLKGHAWAGIARSPNPSSVGFDDRTADRKSRSQTRRLGRVECAEKPGGILGLDTNPDVLDRHQDLFGLAWSRAHDEQACAVADHCYRLHAIDDKIDDDLLQLDSITTHRRQVGRRLALDRSSVPRCLVARQRTLRWRGERLVYFMRNRCVHLSECGHTRDVGERSLRGDGLEHEFI